MRTDFQNLANGDRITLYPRANNPLHKKPVTAIYDGRHFWCDGSDVVEGPDYYLGDVLTFNEGFSLEGGAA